MIKIGNQRFLEQSDIVGISRTTLHRWRKEGRLDYFQIGRRILYSESHIKELLRAQDAQIAALIQSTQQIKETLELQ